MKLSQREDGTRVLDAQGYSDFMLQLTIGDFLNGMQPSEVAELIFDDPSSHEPIELALKMRGYKILENIAGGGVFRLKVKRGR